MERILDVLESGAGGQVIIDPGSVPPQQVYKLMIGSIVPRPIAFVSTVSAEGVRNLAPFSFFNGVCGEPPVISVAIQQREPRKDTYLNIQSTREFVVNIVTEAIAERMNLCSGEYPRGTDEFEVSGLTPVASDLVKPPRVA